MPNPVMAIAGSAVGSTVASVAGGNKAAKATEKSTRDQVELSRYIYDQNREDQTPWREVGAESIQMIGEGIKSGAFTMDDWEFTADPGYEFRRREGEKALQRTAAVGGNFLSGKQVKAAMQYNQDYASGEYGAAFAREAGKRADNFNFLAGASGIGQTAVQSTAASGNQHAARAGNAIAQGGAAQAQIASSMYGNVAGAANQGAENYLTYKMVA